MTGQAFSLAAIARGEKSLQFATFFLNQEMFGINILQVQEILLPQDITPVPLATDHIMGLISLRGQIVTVIDLKKRLGIPKTEKTNNAYQIVVRTPLTLASFQVDGVGDVVEVESEDFEPPPESVNAVAGRFLEGIFPMEKNIVSLLNVEMVLETS